MKNKGGFETGPDAPSRRFSSVWDRLAREPAIGTRAPFDGVSTGSITHEDGTREPVMIRAQEDPYVEGSLRPRLRTLEIIRHAGEMIALNDMAVAFRSIEQETLDALSMFESISID